MHPYTEKLNYYIKNSPAYTNQGITSILELLWESYSQYNPIDNEEIQKRIHLLDKVFDQLDFDDSEMLFCTVFSLCSQYEKQAFIEGIKLGVILDSELIYP